MIKLVKSTFFKEKETKIKLSKFIKNANHLSLGSECLKFERSFAKYQQRKYCVFFNSGSSANLALLQSLYNLGRIKKGDNAGFSAVSWPTSVSPLIQLGLNPVPIDVELDTLNVSSGKLIEVLKRFPLKIFFITNLLGFCDDIDKIREVCDKNKIILIEDNCESLGTIYKNKKLGNYGLASTFSFFVGHQKILRNKFKVNSFYAKYTFYELAYNLRPTEINGFIGNIQLKLIDEIIKIRNNNFFMIAPILFLRDDIYYPIRYKHMDFLSNFAIPLICKSERIRDKVVKKCQGKIEIRPVVGGNITQHPFFVKYSPSTANLLRNSNAALIHSQGLYFGNNPELTKKEIKEIIKIFTSI